MKHLIIVGAGGFGRELFAFARECLGYGVTFDIRGFLDGDKLALKGFSNYPPILGDPLSYVPKQDEVFITALGNIASRRRCVAALIDKCGEFFTLIHKTASLGENVVVGEGSFIAQYAVVSADAKIGAHSCVFQSSVVGHDALVGNFVHIYALCALGGGVVLGDGAQIYPHAVLTPRKKIGANAVVGAGAVVILNVPAGVTVYGNPAAPIKNQIAL